MFAQHSVVEQNPETTGVHVILFISFFLSQNTSFDMIAKYY